MWLNDSKATNEDSDLGSNTSEDSVNGEEIPIWLRGEQRWVSGITENTTCQDVVQVLLQDEQARGRSIGSLEKYHITERWRGVEQPLDDRSKLLNIWNTWGSAQTEVKFALRRRHNHQHSFDHPQQAPSLTRRARYRSDSSELAATLKTLHPRRLHTMYPSSSGTQHSTEELLKLVLAQGEIIRRQLKKLRHSEHQIGYLEHKTHRARVRKHGSNYLLETYLRGLSEAVDPTVDDSQIVDKNSDSGVMTEGDSEQSNKVTCERFSPSSEEFNKDNDACSTLSEVSINEQLELFEKITKINKYLLKHEEALIQLDANLRKYDKNKTAIDEISKSLNKLRTDMTKSACEMQHNEVVLEETLEKLENRKVYLDNLYRDLASEDQEYEMLQALLFSKVQQSRELDNNVHCSYSQLYRTKELLDTLV